MNSKWSGFRALESAEGVANESRVNAFQSEGSSSRVKGNTQVDYESAFFNQEVAIPRLSDDVNETDTTIECVLSLRQMRLLNLWTDPEVRAELNKTEGLLVEQYHQWQTSKNARKEHEQRIREAQELVESRLRKDRLEMELEAEARNEEQIKDLEEQLRSRPPKLWKDVLSFYILQNDSWTTGTLGLSELDVVARLPPCNSFSECQTLFDVYLPHCHAAFLHPNLDLDKSRRMLEKTRIPGDEFWVELFTLCEDSDHYTYSTLDDNESPVVISVIDAIVATLDGETSGRYGEWTRENCKYEQAYLNSTGSSKLTIADLLRSAPQQLGPIRKLYEDLINLVASLDEKRVGKLRKWLGETNIILPEFQTVKSKL
jgi:hypothetical protein